MKPTSSQQKSQELLHTIITKAWEDEDFKQTLIEDPINTIEKATGERLRLPEGKTLIVRDQSNEDAIYINIPSEPNIHDMELNENQLESIAGGYSIWHMPIINLPLLIDTSKDGFK
jgi:hypothetical protein